jgi:putative ABC transport system permease protein
MVAAIWHKKVGDTFTMIAPRIAKADGTHTWTFRVAAIGEDVTILPIGYICANYLYYDQSVPLAERGKINEVDMLVADPAQAVAIAEGIDRIFANSATPTNSTAERTLFAPGSNFGGMDVRLLTFEIALAGLLMILFLIANVIAQSVRERRTEFASLMAIGFPTAAVVALVGAEAALLCLAGALSGVMVAAALAHHVSDIMPPNWGLPVPSMSAWVILAALLSACALAFVSSALPVLRLWRMDIAASLSGRAGA